MVVVMLCIKLSALLAVTKASNKHSLHWQKVRNSEQEHIAHWLLCCKEKKQFENEIYEHCVKIFVVL